LQRDRRTRQAGRRRKPRPPERRSPKLARSRGNASKTAAVTADCGCDDEGQKVNVLLWVYPNLKNTRLFVEYDGRGVRLGSALLPQELENIRATGTKANKCVAAKEYM
jgi:hypothetical protein